MKTSSKTLLAALAIALVSLSSARASILTYTAGTSGVGLAASAVFDNGTSGQLTITLSNIGGEVDEPADVLTALFFSLTDPTSLTPLSATVPAGSAVFFDAAATNVGGEWEYAAVAGPGGANAGIGSAGFGLFGDFNFGGPNLDDPDAVNGLNYGLLSDVDDTTSGNSAVTGGGGNPKPLVQHQTVFVLTTSGIFDLSQIDDVSFQYGTALDEPNITPPPPPDPQDVVPEATSLMIWATLAMACGFGARRRLFA